LFLYTDLDIDTLASNIGQLVGANQIRQQSTAGSIVDVTATGGQNPTSFAMRPYPELETEFEDNSPTFTLNNQTSPLGPTDVTHAFEWDLPTLDAGSSTTVEIVTSGTFSTIVLPSNPNDPDDPTDGFEFNDGQPPQRGDSPRWYDPVVAVGYDYEVTSSGNAFAELYLPGGFTDGQYLLTILDPDHPKYNEQIAVSGDGLALSYDFTADDPDGVTMFRITGIEEDAGIDPNNDLGFPTGLTFVESTPVDFTQTPLVVPEPTTLALMGLGTIALARRRRRC
jgi:hypothetical protein